MYCESNVHQSSPNIIAVSTEPSPVCIKDNSLSPSHNKSMVILIRAGAFPCQRFWWFILSKGRKSIQFKRYGRRCIKKSLLSFPNKAHLASTIKAILVLVTQLRQYVLQILQHKTWHVNLFLFGNTSTVSKVRNSQSISMLLLISFTRHGYEKAGILLSGTHKHLCLVFLKPKKQKKKQGRIIIIIFWYPKHGSDKLTTMVTKWLNSHIPDLIPWSILC